MMNREPGPPEGKPKSGFPGSFFLFLVVAVLVALTVQNFVSTKQGKVGFSYQVQHLVNLQLIAPQESRMVAQKENLVTFSGRFREKETDEGKKRFKFSELLNKEDGFREEQVILTEDLQTDRQAIENAARAFLSLSGLSVGANYQVMPASSALTDLGKAIAIPTSAPRAGNLAELESEVRSLGSDQERLKEFGSRLSRLVQEFRSPILGIGQESFKSRLRSLEQELSSGAPSAALFGKVIGDLRGLVDTLNTPVNGVRLSQLRSVRDFRESLRKYQEAAVQLDQTQEQLDKARSSVGNVIWFFNNQELSTRALEKQDPELYHQWFLQAESEWKNFGANKGLSFKVVDQPRTLALEKTFRSEEPAPNYFSYLFPLLLIGMVVMLLYFAFNRQMKGMGSSAMSFGKSPAKMLGKGMSEVTFKDVAGAEEAKEELVEIVEFLKHPGKFTSLGGKIPRGVLLVGPPGTGKTLIAKAVAGEASRPFFSISGSDFVEMFVGVGASRIRDLFEQAKRNAPCIIFIDEIDAVGRHRGAGIGGGHDEREQTLNQLLVEMDGFNTSEGVILMAATNRPDVLDKALLRPGRFDRRVTIELPDVKGRFEILQVHARHIKIDESVDLMQIARQTPGAAGADLGNLLNEAALLAARKNRKAVTQAELIEASDKVRYGKERRSLEMSEEEKLTTAYHESGHAVVGLVVEHADPVDKVTIIPRGFSLGATHFLPRKNRLSYWKREIVDHLAVAMGGRLAEEIFSGDMSSGAQQDITQATALARSMVCEWGMSDLGMVAYEERESSGQYLGIGGYREKAYSETTAQAIDEEVRRITNEAYNRAKQILEEKRAEVETMTRALMEFETLDSEDVHLIMSGEWDNDKKRERVKSAEEAHKAPPAKEPAPSDEEGPLPEPAS
jgi:cell division protease FtsH